MTDKQKFKPAAVRKRTGSRLAALQFCYSRQMSGDSFAHTLDGFRTSYLDEILKQLTIKKIDEEHFTALITGVDTETDRLDGQIEPLLRQGWTMARLGTHELSILRLGCFELQSLPHIPALAIITEYAAIAEEFNADTGFINAVLDQLARHLRAIEMKAG